MRKLLLLPFTFFLFSFFTANAQQANQETGDNPSARQKYANELEKDPALGYVPYHRLLNAINYTEALKAANRNSNTGNFTSALTWIERGPIFDSVGPSNGNTRGGGNTAGGHTSGRMRAFLLDTLNDPTGNTAFLGGVGGGLWKCTNFLSVENNWAPVNDRFDNLAVSSIAQDPTNPQIIYFSTGEPTDNADRVTGLGVWKSTNGGATFTWLPSTANYMRCFKIGCDAAGNVYLATRIHTTPVNQQSGLFRSSNGGTSWTDITPNNLDPLSSNSCTDFEFTASGNLNAMFGYRAAGNVVNHRYTTAPATVAPGTWLSSTGFRSTNAQAIRTEMAVSGNILYAITITPAYNTDSCYKSIDGGATWTKQNTVVLPAGLGSGQGWYNISLAINPSNTAELISGGLDGYRSVDNGATWVRFTFWVTTAPYVHADHHYAQYWVSGGQTRIIMGTDGGVFYSNNNGTTFTSKNKNIGIKQFYSAAIHPTAGSPYLLAGAQDNGTHSLSNPGLSYSIEVTGGDGCIVHINQQNPLIQYGSYVYNQYRRSTNGGASWQSVNLSGSTGQFVNPFDYDDAQNIMYCGNSAGTIRRWDNANTTNTSAIITVTNMTGSLLSVKYSPYTANTIFFGTNNGRLFRLDNANTAVSTAATDITGASFPTGTIICVNTGTSDQNLVATYTNYGVNNVWVSTNGGTSWSAIDGNLPDMPVRWAMFEPGNNGKLYLATEAGIYTTSNINGASTVWAPETTFPTVSTYMLKMRASDSTIVAGTHGRGLWTAKIPAATATNPTVTINQAAAQPDPTAVSPINFTVVFDQAVTGFATGDVVLTGTAGATTGVVTGSGTTYNVAVSGMTSCGTVIATIPAGVAQNAALEPNLASTSTDNTVTFIIGPAPNVTINQAAAQPDPTSTSPILFTVVFDQVVTGFATGDVTLSGTAGATTGSVSGSGTTYTVSVSGMTSAGTVIATIGAGVAQNACSQPNTASTSTDNTVTYSVVCVPPVVNPVPNQQLCAGSPTNPVNFTSTPPGATFAWTNNAPSIGLPASGTGNIASFIAVNNTAAPVVATITVTPTIGGTSTPVTIPLNAQTGTFAGSARGYFFTAPTAFTMTQLRVPTDASAGNQHIAVVRFTGAVPPPAFPTTTNNFTTLFLTQNNVTVGNIPVNIPIAAGDVIGILGTRGADINSYSLPPNVTTIAGFPVTLTRMGMQFPLATTAPQQLWTEAAAISRIFFDYTTGSAGGCSGPASSFTITVNPNPEVVIVADPGTTICEGDPTRLTVVLGTSTPIGTLYTQGTTPVNGSPSQVFEPANTAFNSQSADDFTVPAGTTWNVTRVTANGIGAGVPTSVNVFIYNNSGTNLPGTVVASYPNLTTFTQAGGNYTVTLPSALSLGSGTYWLSVQVNMSFATSGQWFWGNFGAANIGSEYAWQNPGGGFATPCTNWGYGGTGCNVGGGPGNRNNVFSIIGSSITGGGPLPPGYTFLWSPAAGLSSTTSNPVAASPMNTTTYTVVVTGPPGGPTACTRTASILITVNKRPTVTTHPASRTNCAGSSATFTVGATGTGLTYQWQVSPTGCAGPWSNINNGGPYLGATTATLTVNPVTGLMNGYAYRVVLGGVCAPVNNNNISNCAVLSVNPLPNVAITPVGPVCGGVACSFGTMLSVGSAPPPVPGTVTVNSGTINLAVPDGVAAGTSTAITIAGVPANATITNISVALNMPHTYPHDMIIGLKGPSGQVLSLYKHNTNTTAFPPASIPTAGWYNAVVNKTSSTVFSTVPDPFRYGQTAPAGPYKADALNGVTSAGYTINDQTGFVSNAANFDALYTTAASINSSWTLALCDGGAGDIGILSSWSMTIDYTTPGTGGGPVLSYVWSPLAGLYTDAAACIPYTGTNTPVVYAAPTTLTVYTVTATDVATGCQNTSSVVVNYTPPPPTVVPASVTMCLGDPAVRLTSSSSSSSSSTVTASSGTISVPIPDGTGAPALSTLNIAGVPTGPGAAISEVKITMNVSHTWVGDVDVNIQAPNNAILNLVGGLDGGAGGNASDDFTNTAFSSIGVTAISGAAAPRTGTYAAEARAGYGPTGYIQTVNTWGGLVPTSASANGTWRLALADWVGTDVGTLTSWSIAVTTTVTTGVPATRATWSPLFGLWNDQAMTQAYTGDARDTVWTRPTPAGVYPYQVTIQSLPAYLPTPATFTNPAPVTITNGGSTPYPSNLAVTGLPTTGTNVRSVLLTGLSHTWSDDIDIMLQSPTGQNVILMSDVGGASGITNATYTFSDAAGNMGAGANPTGTYHPTNLVGTLGVEPDNFPAPGPGPVAQPTPALSMFTGNMNGTWKLFAVDDFAGDDGTLSGGYTINFNVPVAPCTSPARTVIVTVNQPTTVTTQPVNQTICTDKVATFSVVAAGTGPFTYQWQVSTNSGNTWTNVTNGGVYSGATTATLTITAPPVSMSGYLYRVVINGAAPCAAVTSFQVVLTVNPLPVVVISAAPYTSLFPGLVTTLTSTVSPNAAAIYTWLRNGVAVPGASTGTLNVNVDGLGSYQLRVQDVNGCIGTSNTVIIKDSASGKCFIYPNPTSGRFQVRYHSVANNAPLPRTLTVYDAKGDRVFTQLYTIGRPYDRMDVDMRAYGKGLYWVEIGDANGNRLTMCRVVIQ